GKLVLRHECGFYEAISGCERLFVQGVEGQLLSRGHEARGDARLLQRAPADGGDQQHLLPHAEDRNARALVRDHAPPLPLPPPPPPASPARPGPASRLSRTSSRRRRPPSRFSPAR